MSTTVDKSDDRVRRMFGEIAPRYDRMNHLLSMQVDRYWRWRAARRLALKEPEPVLDLCTGTGDLALVLARRARGKVPVVAADFCPEMLELGREKLARKRAALPVTFVEADAQDLPFSDEQFQAVTVAFGLRNVSDTDRGLREMVRVCRPGGTVVVLEFSMPRAAPLRALYGWYFRRVLPRIGNWLSRNRAQAYDYLPDSVAEFPQGRELAGRMEAAGLRRVVFRPLTCGVATLYVGTK